MFSSSHCLLRLCSTKNASRTIRHNLASSILKSLCACIVLAMVTGEEAHAQNVYNISGGNYTFLDLFNHDIANISGGFFSDDIELYQNSTANISGGFFTDGLYSNGSTFVNVSGGTFDGEFVCDGNTLATITGGIFNVPFLVDGGSSTINIYGHGLTYNGPLQGFGSLNGFLADGSSVDGLQVFIRDSAQLNLFNVSSVPEVPSFLLFGAGVLMPLGYSLWRRRKTA